MFEPRTVRAPSPPLHGRDRECANLDALLTDVRGDLAELYGYVNRSLPDAELDDFVALAACVRAGQGAADVQSDLDPTQLAALLIEAWEPGSSRQDDAAPYPVHPLRTDRHPGTAALID